MDVKSKKKKVLADKSVERGGTKYYSMLVDEVNEEKESKEFGRLSHRIREIVGKVER